LKEKRQERAAFLKEQADERKRTQKPKRQEGEDEDEDAAPSAPGLAPGTEKRKREVTKLLPLELLESDDEDDVPQQPSSAADKHKRRKLGGAEQALLREPKLPKDKRLGSTAYRVVKGTGDARLAPSVKKQAVSLKETLLRRNRVPQSRGGFFVKSR
jgi:U3 small nucleolar RNA-associated protein 16